MSLQTRRIVPPSNVVTPADGWIETVHVAGPAGYDRQSCALCRKVLVDNHAAYAGEPRSWAAPFYAEGAHVVSSSGTTWGTARDVSCTKAST